MTRPVLGRHVEHDKKSRDFPAKAAKQVGTVWHKHHSKPLDQGQLGSCTCNALVQCLATDPLWVKGFRCTEKLAVDLYELATTLDNVPGTYPPTDSGSTGIAAAKAAQQRGLISSYTHCFGIEHALSALQLSPFIVGTSWTAGMFDPDADGFVTPSGKVEGGHEYLCLGFDADRDAIAFLNSWGAWGTSLPKANVKTGGFWMRRADFAELLSMQGDVTVPVR